MEWPGDADGDVFRRLAEDGFDFSVRHRIDFQVDFEKWPPPDSALTILRRTYPNAARIDPEDGFEGYVEFSETDYLTYPYVIRVQANATKLMAPFQGLCRSWGVLHEQVHREN